jgi:integrase
VAEQATEIDGHFTWGPPKTEAGRRTVTLPAVAAAAALAEHLATYSQPGPDELVFTSTEGGLLRRSNFNRRVWQPATRAAGLAGLRFHDLRHTSATLSIAAGASTRELMARMGHSSSAAALRYQHVLAGRDTAIAAALDELIEAASALGERPPSAPSGTRVARIGQSDKDRKRR